MQWLSRILVLIGALNWGLIGLFRFNLVSFLFGGTDSFLTRLIYGLVGLAGLYMLADYTVRKPVEAQTDK